MNFRGSNHRHTLIEWSMLLLSMILKILFQKCKSTLNRIRTLLRSQISLLIKQLIEQKKLFNLMNLLMSFKMILKCQGVKKLHPQLKSIQLMFYLDHTVIMNIARIKECHVSSFIQRKFTYQYCNLLCSKPHLLAMSMIENLTFDERADISGKSYDSHVLVVDFKDQHIFSLSYVLETPIEISCIEWHPDS